MHERFRYKTKNDLLDKARELGLNLPFVDDISPLFIPAQVSGHSIHNRLVVQPMEGYDSEHDGSPSSLTKRRYLRYASGGSGIIWYEAVSVTHDGRSNPHQLWLHKDNADTYAQLNERIKKEAFTLGINPFLVVQLTHSGRYSKPDGHASPLAATANPVLDRVSPRILTDDELKRIQDQYIIASKIAFRSGFEAVDLKACHGYLMVDLLSARGRDNSVYGGQDKSSRFRFLLETIDRIKDEVPGIIVTTRLNISDLYLNGFGVDEKGDADFNEPLQLVEELKSRRISLINISMGSPYFNPHVARPYDTPLPGLKVPDEHPLSGVSRIIQGTSFFQKRFPEMLIIGSAYSYLRHYAPNVGAAVIKNGDAAFIGFGRNSFAYPSMPLDLIKSGKADPSRVCITCSGCTRLIRNLRPGGCVIRDKEIYGKELKKLIADGK